jgi:hypothetical protein
MPSLVRRIKNFSVAAITHFLNGSPTCTDNQILERFEICKKCEFFRPRKLNPAVGKCSHIKCGCSTKALKAYLNKLAWADQECPIQKWRKIDK